MATSAQVAEFRQANQSLVLLALRDLTQFWAALNTLGNPEVVRDSMLAFFPELVTAYGDTAAVLGADWYDALRNVPPSAASFSAAIAQPAPITQAQGTVRWAMGPLFAADPAPAAVLKRLSGAAQRLVLQPGRDSVFQSAGTDPVRTAVARVPSGSETCKWCIRLAARGAVYGSERAAGGEGNHFHDDCNCVPTVIRSRDDYPEDHDLGLYRRLLAEQSGLGRDIPPNE